MQLSNLNKSKCKSAKWCEKFSRGLHEHAFQCTINLMIYSLLIAGFVFLLYFNAFFFSVIKVLMWTFAAV